MEDKNLTSDVSDSDSSEISGNETNTSESSSGKSVGEWILAIFVGIIMFLIGLLVGNNKGYEKGFKDASKIYEKKLKKLTESFLSTKKTLEANMDEYKELLNLYECYIAELEERLGKGEKVGEVVDFLKEKERRLLALQEV